MSETKQEHKVIAPSGKQIGWRCECGAKFSSEKQAKDHVAATLQEDIKPEPVPAATVAAPETPKPKPSPDLPVPKNKPAGGRSIQSYLNDDQVREYIKDRVEGNIDTFISAIMAVVNGKPELQVCTPKSVLGAAIEASTLNLSVNPNLGQAAIVPYKNKGVDEAAFQMMYKGFVQLGMRSGQYKSMSAGNVFEGQLVDKNPMTGNIYDWNAQSSEKVIGYFAYFKLLNGFEKDDYISIEDARKHAQRYSKAYRSGFGPWKDNFDAMGQKTVLKRVIDKYGPKSVEMERALLADAGVIEEGEVDYPDNLSEVYDKIEAAKSGEELQQILTDLSVDEQKQVTGAITDRMKELAAAK